MVRRTIRPGPLRPGRSQSTPQPLTPDSNFRFPDGADFIQFDVQYILDPGGAGDIHDALVVGTQLGLNF